MNSTPQTNSLTSAANLTDEQIEAMFESAGATVYLSDPSDRRWIAVTAETLDDFKAARQNWNERGRIVRDEPGESLVIEDMQIRSGDQRAKLTVVDLGAVRVTYTL